MKLPTRNVLRARSTLTRNASLPLLLLVCVLPFSMSGQQNPPRGPAAAGVKPSVGVSQQTAPTQPSGVGGLLGSTVSWQYYAYGGPYVGINGPDNGTFVVNGGVGGTFSPYFNIIGSANSITFDYNIPGAVSGTWSPSALSLPPAIYNGIAINMVSGQPFLAVVIDPATNMVGFDSSRISFTSNQIQVDWQNLPWTPTTIVRLDVITPNAQLCQQDQYGNQYNFTVDDTLNYVYGTVSIAQAGCTSPTWNLIGSYAKNSKGFQISLSAGNPTPADGCSSLYTLAGPYPNFEWLYSTGGDNPQNSSYVACGTQAAAQGSGRGVLK